MGESQKAVRKMHQKSHNFLTKTFKTVINKHVGEYINLIAFIHNHDGYNGSHPETIGNQWESDQNTRKIVYEDTLKKSDMLARFMTVHEGLGNILIELNRNGHKKTSMTLTPETLKGLNKIHYKKYLTLTFIIKKAGKISC